MGDKSTIEWTDATWNPVTGCTKVSQGCKNCYAERVFPRAYGTERKFTDVRTHPERLDQPLRWAKPRRIFVNSMSDLFHEDLSDDFLDQVFTIIRRCEVQGKGHVFQVLTKRPQRMLDFMREIPVPSNLWLGVSVEDQATADERIPLLIRTPAAVRFISAEPLLGPINLWSKPIMHGRVVHPLDWCIAGGESGPRARPSHPDWFIALRDQCRESGVRFFFKQWGEWAPGECGPQPMKRTERTASYFAGSWSYSTVTPTESMNTHSDDAPDVHRFGKKASGRHLDGRTHDEYPA